MAPPSTSLPPTPHPSGIETHTMTHRSASTPHTTDPAYASIIAVAPPVSPRTSGSSTPCRLPAVCRTLLKKQRVVLLTLTVIFEISLVLLTIAIVLAADHGHEGSAGDNIKAAMIIIGIFGVAGMISSLTMTWMIVQGRRGHASLNRQWSDEEGSSVKEIGGAAEIVKTMKETKGQNRSRSQSRGRTVIRKEIPSFRALTSSPTPIPPPTEETVDNRASNYTHFLDLSNSEKASLRSSEENDAKSMEAHSPAQATINKLSQEILAQVSRPTSPQSQGSGIPTSPTAFRHSPSIKPARASTPTRPPNEFSPNLIGTFHTPPTSPLLAHSVHSNHDQISISDLHSIHPAFRPTSPASPPLPFSSRQSSTLVNSSTIGHPLSPLSPHIIPPTSPHAPPTHPLPPLPESVPPSPKPQLHYKQSPTLQTSAQQSPKSPLHSNQSPALRSSKTTSTPQNGNSDVAHSDDTETRRMQAARSREKVIEWKNASAQSLRQPMIARERSETSLPVGRVLDGLGLGMDVEVEVEREWKVERRGLGDRVRGLAKVRTGPLRRVFRKESKEGF